MLVHGIGAWAPAAQSGLSAAEAGGSVGEANPPVASQSEIYALLKSWGLPTSEYFRVVADKRDLNYSQYFEQGDPRRSAFEDYDSHTVERMTIQEVEELLLTLPEVRSELSQFGVDIPDDLGRLS